MRSSDSLRSYLERKILRQSVYVLMVLGLFAVSMSYLISRNRVATDIEESAQAIAKAYRSRILEGDIKVTQSQLHELLHLGPQEQVLILDKNRTPLYKEIGTEKTELKGCTVAGVTCFENGSAQIFLPLYFDAEKTALYGYLYLSRHVDLDWIFVGLVFLVFSIGYFLLYFGFSNLTKRAAEKLSGEISVWSSRLNQNPKDSSPLPAPPFIELNELKSSIEGLHEKIRRYENEASHNAKILVLRGIAHDLLGPVAQMQFQCASLKHLVNDSESTELIQDLNDSLGRISLIASQVKNLDQSSKNADCFDLSEVLSLEVLTLAASPEIQRRSLNLEFIGEPNIQPNISKGEIVRIVQNLVSNSANASPSGGDIRVTVSKGQGNAVIEVKDHGCGIAAHLKEKVFEPDFTSKPGVGTGLGLAIVRHICSQRNGVISLQSEIGAGTTIRVSVPLIDGGKDNEA